MQLTSMGKQGDTHRAKLNSEFKIDVFFCNGRIQNQGAIGSKLEHTLPKSLGVHLAIL